ncbi:MULTISPECIES: hypothetical protein [unclassified Pseudomonas]|uniref:hypothetical protein n=1 Tax=unclassified Pseudomonas TaxID=196821 RepID=UPI000D37AE42|nr:MULTISPECIES: hypothetical protein [unclassified Pseudomonas]RAU43677.1 hypothetical protein DBP26_019305 [Pseudomonas sp. RIT 409]RAU54391.1 hypothetical protein DBY65_008665 [Pseudomonas sp. RIT 412]
MTSTNASVIAQEGQFTLVASDKLVNSSTLQAQAQPLAALGFLTLNDTLPLIHRIAAKLGKPLSDKWADVATVSAQQDDFFRALKTAGIAERVPGDIARRGKLDGRKHAFGEIDYRPGLWLHRDLALPYARWIGSRVVPPRKTPLESFLEKHLSTPLPAAEKPKPVAVGFAGEVDAQGMKDLERIDRVMMADGVSAAERIEVLTARVEAMQGA